MSNKDLPADTQKLAQFFRDAAEGHPPHHDLAVYGSPQQWLGIADLLGLVQTAQEPTAEMIAQFETGIGALFSPKEAFLFGWKQASCRASTAAPAQSPSSLSGIDMVECCKSCKFFVGGDCRRQPPVRLPRQFADNATAGCRVRDETILWGWPRVEPTQWCGEYRPEGGI